MTGCDRHTLLPPMARRGLMCALFAATLSGCISTPLPKLATPLPAHWRNQSTAAASNKRTDLTSWWYRFDDAQLNALVAQSLHSNLKIAQAVEHLRAAHVLATHSDAPFRPSVGFRTYHPVDPNANASYFVVGFAALWDLGLFGRRQGSLRKVHGQLAMAGADLRLARVNVVAEVVRDWINLGAAQQRIRLLERIRDKRHAIVHIETVRLHLGLDAPAKLAQARAAAATAEADLTGPRQAANAAAQHLALLMGRNEPVAAWIHPHALPRLRGQALTLIPATMLTTRPQIAIARAKVLQAAGALGIAHADRFPNVGLGGSIIWSTSTIAHHGEPSNAIASIGPTIDIPLLDWGLRKARATAKGHDLKASVLAYRQAVLEGVATVETALGDLAQARHREYASIKACYALTRAATTLATRKHLGLVGSIASAQSDIAQDKAMLAVISARQTRDVAYAAIYEALGGASDPPASGATTVANQGSDHP